MEFQEPIRIVIADDSFFMRSIISSILKEEPRIELIGAAKNGVEVVAMAVKQKPNIVLMDYNMPEMDGEEATRRIMETMEEPPAIIMFSARTKEGAEETLRCLSAGAIDFLAKPSGETSINLDSVKDLLLEKIKVAFSAKAYKNKLLRRAKKPCKIGREGELKVVVIGASTGGPPVVENILSGLPNDLNAAILVVQHMPEKFTSFFAERLNKIATIKIKEAEKGDKIEKGACLVAPGGWHMVVGQNKNEIKEVDLNKEPAFFSLRPAINNTMISVAREFGENVIGIILTGMGYDGTEGIKEVKKYGGYTIAQSPETSVIDSMPSSIIKNDLADEILPPSEIIERIIKLCN